MHKNCNKLLGVWLLSLLFSKRMQEWEYMGILLLHTLDDYSCHIIYSLLTFLELHSYHFHFLIKTCMQVETVAQFGVIFLLFALGLEFSATKVGM